MIIVNKTVCLFDFICKRLYWIKYYYQTLIIYTPKDGLNNLIMKPQFWRF